MKHLNIVQKSKVSTNMLLLLFFLLTLEDYLLTYLGIHTLRVLEEVNPLMVGLLSLPLAQGHLLKILTALLPILLLKVVEPRLDALPFRRILFLPIAIQIIPYTAHAIWIYKYLRIMNTL